MNIQLYIQQVLGENISLNPLPRIRLKSLPVYITETYRFFSVDLYQKELIFVQPRDLENLSVLQTEKQFLLLKGVLGRIVLLLPQITAYNRKRLIEKGVNFVVPGKQLFLPDLLIDLREGALTTHTRRKVKKLLPSAQFLVIYHLIHLEPNWSLENCSFKVIAEKTGYTPMAITKAIDNLKEEEIVSVTGEKEKAIKFKEDRAGLWGDILNRNLFVNPVQGTVYCDIKPQKDLLLTHTSALPEYSNINPSKQLFYAIAKESYYSLLRESKLNSLSEQDGEFGIEIWKYDPLKLVGDLPNDQPVVDPLSLYLSMKDNTDERIEMALDQIVEKYI